LVAPSPAHAFFEQAVFQGQISHQFLQSHSLSPQFFDLAAAGLTGGVASQTLLAVRRGLEPMAARASPRNSFDQL
jgi:hypothetical protein